MKYEQGVLHSLHNVLRKLSTDPPLRLQNRLADRYCFVGAQFTNLIH